MLERFGLDAEAARVYRARLLAPEDPDEALAEATGLTVLQVRDATDRLAHVGLVTPLEESGDGKAVRPRSPEVALSAYLRREEQQLARRHAELQAMREQADTFADDYRRERDRRGTEQVEVLATRAETVTRMSELNQGVRRSVRSFVATKYPVEVYASSLDEDGGVLDRGVDVRVVHLDSVTGDPQIRPHLAAFARAGAAVRSAPRLPVRMVVYDAERALVARDPHDPTQGAVVLTSPGVVAALVALFDLVWRQSADLLSPGERAGAREGAGPPAADLELLRLLLDGHTDESSARALQVSPRTVRRMIADLQRRAGATSRFELAARAVDLGWLRL